MKKILLILFIIPLILFYKCIKDDKGINYITSRDPGTGIGWAQQRTKVNFKDSINLNKGWMIKDTVILTSAKHFNFLRGVQSNVQSQINLKLNISDTLLMLSNYALLSEVAAIGMTYPVGSGIPLVVTGASWGTTITNNSVNWDSAYAARLRWSGTAIGLTASTGRTSLGGTTVGQAFFTLTNPGAITFPRMNADNTVTALSAANFKTALTLTSSDVGLGNVTNKAQVEVEDSAAMLNPYLKGYDVIANLTAGVLTDIPTIRTVFPQSIQIFTSAGKDITAAVYDSLGLSGGVYHLYVYSVDALANVKIKFSY